MEMSAEQTITKTYRSGFIALVGRPNVGKSTLINQLLGEKLAITSPVAQTTRNRLRAILTTSNGQLILVDTPGIHKPHHLLGEKLVKSAKSSIGEVDVVVFLVDASQKPGKGDFFIINLLKNIQIPVLVVLNKWDLVQESIHLKRGNEYQDLCKDSKWPLLKCSGFNGKGCKDLITKMTHYLPIGPQLYPPEMKTDQPEKILIAELIREQVLLGTREEIPHSVAVSIDSIDEQSINKGKNKGSKLTSILATILVERKSQKMILIGKNGSMVKSIGQGARLQINNLIEGSIYLELFIKVVPHWRSKPARLKELGYELN
tara:strand:+ start:182 stop:1132 length:951 start_codon:yes stop_codon:yes gene_type:complete